ncbi:MAG TPA: acyltransferase family protein [Bryobacteraceae bacterium]|nr:acyltransferase family protein [Bryobacteraceae bacterium]
MASPARPLTVAKLQPDSATRLIYIDNLRWTMMILVISMHAADTYSPLGNWYYTDRSPLNTASVLSFAAWQMYLQSFFMGLLFFIAGYFVPASLERKGIARFVRDRGFRLGLPVLFYMFVLGPVVEYFLAHSWNSTRPTTFPHEWIKHIRNGQFLQENGPLWFCLALLIFSVVYAILPRRSAPRPTAAPGTSSLAGFAFVMATGAFFVRATLPPGFTLLNMHLGDFAQYILLFAAGILAARGRWLPELSFPRGIRWLMILLPLGFGVWLSVLLAGGALTGNGRAFSSGWHWQNAAISAWESFTCVAICFGLLVVFREKLDSQGRVAKFLSDNAFSVYVFHPVFVIAAARAMHGLAWLPLVKFALLALIAAVLSFAASAAVFRRLPLLRGIL